MEQEPGERLIPTGRQVDLVQRSFACLAAHGQLFGCVFYERMFEQNPNIRHLFKNDEAAQAAKFMDMIATLVAGLPRMEQLKPAVRHLGLRHLHYGVRSRDYAAFGKALIWTLEHFLKVGFDSETRAAWIVFYDSLVGLMCDPGNRPAETVPTEGVGHAVAKPTATGGLRPMTANDRSSGAEN